MSNAGGKEIKLSDGIIEREAPVPDPKTEAVKGASLAGILQMAPELA